MALGSAAPSQPEARRRTQRRGGRRPERANDTGAHRTRQHALAAAAAAAAAGVPRRRLGAGPTLLRCPCPDGPPMSAAAAQRRAERRRSFHASPSTGWVRAMRCAARAGRGARRTEQQPCVRSAAVELEHGLPARIPSRRPRIHHG
eukprot:361630-Chlamydomonas_euryale.AAC.1